MKSEKCNQLAVEIWNWCISNNLYISAEHVRGVNNVEADYISRNQNNSGEWSLCQITVDAGYIDVNGVLKIRSICVKNRYT